ncbi:MAG TPA: hypothetical protein VI603_08705 [Saprospiraceae bacterium]|nr:hypothetical protein [Saprospiraceae bacterium]
MKALEFKTRITENVIKVPSDIQAEIESSGGDELRVIVLFEDDDKEIWSQLSSMQFLDGYSVDDYKYDLCFEASVS